MNVSVDYLKAFGASCRRCSQPTGRKAIYCPTCSILVDRVISRLLDGEVSERAERVEIRDMLGFTDSALAQRISRIKRRRVLEAA